jgi:two-component system, NtrC family, nitrogen regulation response regulator NtrX
MSDTILIVDDEESVRRTFQEWLQTSGLDCRILVAADAEAALRHANQSPIDLAILDWNLGAGNDGLQLLQDLAVFHPDIVAILVTGYAHQATPLDALRMGVRDYLDKNQGLNRESFLASVRKQLARIAPAKQQRELNRSLAAFRAAVEKVLPLVQSASVLNDPVPLPRAIAALSAFLCRLTGAADAVLLGRHAPPDQPEVIRAWTAAGEPLTTGFVAFGRSLAAAALSQGEPRVLTDLSAIAGVELQPFEQGRKSLLAVPLPIGGGSVAVLELFDRPGGFRDEDRKMAAAAAEIGVELLRQSLADRQTRRTLFDAVAAALEATKSVTAESTAPEAPPPQAVLDSVQAGLAQAGLSAAESAAVLRLSEAVRALAVKHGAAAVEHCRRVVSSVEALLDDTDEP